MRRLFLLTGIAFGLGLFLSAGDTTARAEDKDEIKANIAKLPEADRKIALEQKICPVENEPLGSMGVPVKITLKGQPVFLCCGGCKEAAQKDPEDTLKKVAELKKKNKK